MVLGIDKTLLYVARRFTGPRGSYLWQCTGLRGTRLRGACSSATLLNPSCGSC
jgi:hypothetical protein